MAASDYPAGWVASGQATNATATATQAAPSAPAGGSAKKLVVMGVDATFSAAPAASVLLQIKDGTTVICQGYASTQAFQRQFVRWLAITPGNAASAVLAAGGASIVGSVNMDGVTV